MIKGYEAFIMQSNYHKKINIKFKAISYTYSSNS